MTLRKINTRFRAYQLGSAGSSYSYYFNEEFILVEARLNDKNRESLNFELSLCEKRYIDILHITSWDSDHCELNELVEILESYKPNKIQTPGYPPHSETGKECLGKIEKYRDSILNSADENKKKIFKLQSITPEYILGLESSEVYGYKNVIYWPKRIDVNHSNNCSTVKFFRKGSFNVLSTGDVEDHNIGLSFLGKILENELDILVLPHHGSSNGCIKKTFLEKTRPHVGICTSNYDNQFDHPADEIKLLFKELEIPIFTTKTGDVVIRSIQEHDGEFEVINLISNSEKISKIEKFQSKKKKLLSNNLDTIRNLTQKAKFKGPPR